MNINIGDILDTILSFAIVLGFVFFVNYITNVIKKRKSNKNNENEMKEGK